MVPVLSGKIILEKLLIRAHPLTMINLSNYCFIFIVVLKPSVQAATRQSSEYVLIELIKIKQSCWQGNKSSKTKTSPEIQTLQTDLSLRNKHNNQLLN